jgi:hypothetical protein
MRKLLIASGCSFTKNKFQDLKFWPELLAEKLDMDFVNLGRGGASNQYIHDITIDTIYESKNIGLVVSAWSGFDRTISLDSSELSKVHLEPGVGAGLFINTPIPECPFGVYDVVDVNADLKTAGNVTQSRKYPRYMIEKGIRNMLSLSSFCRDKNLPYLQLASIMNCMPLVSKEIAKLMLQYKPFMDLDRPNIIGWPFFKIIGGFHFYEIINCSDKRHPSQDGHEVMSNIIYKKYGEIYD